MYHVLIADGEPTLRASLKRLLDWSSMGYTITDEAAGGEQALQKILSKSPDVTLIDIRMPGFTGLEVIRRAREAGFEGKIVILSGYSDFQYAREAMRYGVQYYLTKPVDGEELSEVLNMLSRQLDVERTNAIAAEYYRLKARDAIIQEIVLGKASLPNRSLSDLHMETDVYQIVICQPYKNAPPKTPFYQLAELLHLANQDNVFFDNINLEHNEVFLLKGSYAVGKFASLLEQYEQDRISPLDAFFLTYGRCVYSVEEIPQSYRDAVMLLDRRFFCDRTQHSLGYTALSALQDNTAAITPDLLTGYSAALLNYIQAFNRGMVAETLEKLQQDLYHVSGSADDIRLFLIDLYLSVKDEMRHLYRNTFPSFTGNTEIISFINSGYFLYEILLFLAGQFESMMTAIGNSSRDSVLDDILRYIDHNFSGTITLENIALLFGYNSSYLGRIFKKKMGESFNSYIDRVRIDRSRELLLKEDSKVYVIAEKVGYHNPDYFYTKFKKYVGMSPAEYRKRNRP